MVDHNFTRPTHYYGRKRKKKNNKFKCTVMSILKFTLCNIIYKDYCNCRGPDQTFLILIVVFAGDFLPISRGPIHNGNSDLFPITCLFFPLRKYFEGVADRSVLLTLMKQEVTEKWQKIYVNSPKSGTLQDVITEVGKSQPSIGDRKVEAIINQLITGQVGLNYLTSKIDKNKSPNCDLYSEKETIDHYIFKCKKYHSQRQVLEREIEEILARNTIIQTDINLKVLTGNINGICRAINLELKTAFRTFLRSTGRLIN